MPELTPEEKQKIYEEEKARLEAQAQIKKKPVKKKTKPATWGCLILIILFSLIFIIPLLVPDKETRQAKDAGKERQRISQYNKEHKEEHYLKGLKYLEKKSYSAALNMFSKVTSVDENYKDTQKQVQKIQDALTKIKIADAKKKIAETGELLKSNNCYDIRQAINKCSQALKTLPNSKTAKNYLYKAKLKHLRCYEGNNKIQMAIRIEDNAPLKLYVWIKNISNRVRHANPNHFTLVNISNVSLSVSTKTYGLSNYFDAVDLQPGTETSGALIFDTYVKPKKLVYSETFGSTISREFPFD